MGLVIGIKHKMRFATDLTHTYANNSMVLYSINDS